MKLIRGTMATASAVRVAPRRTPARRWVVSGRRRWIAIRRVLAVLLAAPLAIRIVVAGVGHRRPLVGGELGVPGGPQADELFFPVSGALSKTPAQTWRSYGSLFRGTPRPP